MKASRLVSMTMSSVLLAGIALSALVGSAWSRLERSQQQLNAAVSMQHQAERLDDAVHAWLLLGDRNRMSDSTLRTGAEGQAILVYGLIDGLTGAAPDSVATIELRHLREQIQRSSTQLPDSRNWRAQSPRVVSLLEAARRRIDVQLQAATARAASDQRLLWQSAAFGTSGYAFLLMALWLWIHRRLHAEFAERSDAALARLVDEQVQSRTAVLLRQNRALKAAEAKIAAARDAAEAENNARAALVSNLNHDIRTPLNGILGLTELMLQDVSRERDRQRMQTIMGSGRMLLRVVNSVLDAPIDTSGKYALSSPKNLSDARRLSADVLLAEDNSINQIVIREMLEHLGCRVDVAENGRMAVEQSALKAYDLILMDWHMPESTESRRQSRFVLASAILDNRICPSLR